MYCRFYFQLLMEKYKFPLSRLRVYIVNYAGENVKLAVRIIEPNIQLCVWKKFIKNPFP